MKPELNTKTDYIVTQAGNILGTFGNQYDAKLCRDAAIARGWARIKAYSRVTCTETIYQEVTE